MNEADEPLSQSEFEAEVHRRKMRGWKLADIAVDLARDLDEVTHAFKVEDQRRRRRNSKPVTRAALKNRFMECADMTMDAARQTTDPDGLSKLTRTTTMCLEQVGKLYGLYEDVRVVTESTQNIVVVSRQEQLIALQDPQIRLQAALLEQHAISASSQIPDASRLGENRPTGGVLMPAACGDHESELHEPGESGILQSDELVGSPARED